MNEAAKKLVAREARAEAQSANILADVDDAIAEAWEATSNRNPEFRQWSGARGYFEIVFFNEFERAGEIQRHRSRK